MNNSIFRMVNNLIKYSIQLIYAMPWLIFVLPLCVIKDLFTNKKNTHD